MAKQSLGRGFDSLIPKDLDPALLGEDKHRVQKVLINDIIPNQEQPRSNFSDQALGELTDSIKRHGVLQPIIIVRHGNRQYRIVAGERRWRAAGAAGLTHVPAIIRSLEELEQLEIALIENIQRVDLSPLEQALAIQRLQQHFSLTLEEIAQKLGRAVSTLSNLTRLLQLPLKVRQLLANRQISEAHARAVLALAKRPAAQEELIRHIIEKGWTVRQAEQFAVAAKKGLVGREATVRTASESPLTKSIAESLKLPVRIVRTARGGRLVISFNSEAELKRLSEQLLGKPQKSAKPKKKLK